MTRRQKYKSYYDHDYFYQERYLDHGIQKHIQIITFRSHASTGIAEPVLFAGGQIRMWPWVMVAPTRS